MAGGHKIRGRKKNKYRKLHSDKEQAQVQDEEGSCQAVPPAPEQPKAPRGKKQRSSKKVHLSPLPDRYQPLDETPEIKEDKKYKRKQKVKKYAKNVGKAIRTGCHYLIVGFQALGNAYSAPIGITSVVLSSMAR